MKQMEQQNVKYDPQIRNRVRFLLKLFFLGAMRKSPCLHETLTNAEITSEASFGYVGS